MGIQTLNHFPKVGMVPSAPSHKQLNKLLYIQLNLCQSGSSTLREMLSNELFICFCIANKPDYLDLPFFESGILFLIANLLGSSHLRITLAGPLD
jgi:hypothetical protein